MKKTITMLLMVGMLWASWAWGQDGYRGYDSGRRESMSDRWAQEDAMRRQRYEAEDARHRLRQAEAERDRLQSENYDLERQRTRHWSPLPRR